MAVTSDDAQMALWVTNDAIRRVHDHANEDWMIEAHTAIFAVALRMPRFTTDDVWDALSETEATTHEPRALGAVIRKAAEEGLCAPSRMYQQSRRRACHGRPLRVWKSLIYQ